MDDNGSTVVKNETESKKRENYITLEVMDLVEVVMHQKESLLTLAILMIVLG